MQFNFIKTHVEATNPIRIWWLMVQICVSGGFSLKNCFLNSDGCSFSWKLSYFLKKKFKYWLQNKTPFLLKRHVLLFWGKQIIHPVNALSVDLIRDLPVMHTVFLPSFYFHKRFFSHEILRSTITVWRSLPNERMLTVTDRSIRR